MDALSDKSLIVVIQSFQLAIDYQHEKLRMGDYDEEDAADIEEYLVQADLILGEIKSSYEKLRRENPDLPPIAEIPRIDL